MADQTPVTDTPAVDPDEFKDALEEEDVDSEVTFEVTKEELSICRAQLASDYPDDYNYLSDTYILSVASKPYSKDPSVRRPLEYTMEKLGVLMEWRKENAVDLLDMVNLAVGPETATEAVENPSKLTQGKALVNSLNYSSMYWHGLDKQGRPILWIRCDRMPWYPDVEAQTRALILLADIGISKMPEGTTDFVVLSDSNSPPPPNPQFMISLLGALVKGYPDRLHQLVSCPVGSILQYIMKLLLPLMPSRLASKIILISQEESKEKLNDILLNGEDDIPTFLGGTSSHDELFPYEGKFPKKDLKFDLFGMEERLEKVINEFHSKK